jgi:phenylacetic acid degradation operon negative regulatory protein
MQPQELVLTMFGAYARDGAPAWSGGLVRLLGDFGFSTSAARGALNRVVDRGLLERDRNGRFIAYRPTERTRELIAVGDRRMAALSEERAWDGTWTVVWYSIPEGMRRERHRLSRRLRFLGFGPLEDSTWVAPGDQREELVRYLERLGVSERVGVFWGPHALPPAVVIERAWDGAELARRYREFAREFRRPRARTDGDAFVARTRLIHVFRRFPYLDPGLPDELLPAGEARRAAVAVFAEQYAALEPRAQRYFDEVARATVHIAAS